MSTATATPPFTETPIIPATMQAAVYRGINDIRIETVPVPKIGAGEILIQVACCGICGTDLKKIHTGSHSAPRIFGHETAGTVAAVGKGVRDFSTGDRVMVFHHIPCRTCYYCRKHTYAQCETYKRVGVTAGFEPAGGGFAGYVRVMDWIVRDCGVIRIPDHVPFEQAAFVEPVNTCLKGVKMLNLQPDETVLVIGQGPIGIILASLALRTGATVLTSDLYPERHAIAAEFGLLNPINAQENVAARVRAVTEGRGADAVLLAVGHDALIQTAMDSVRPGGKVQLFAQTQHGEASFDPAAVCMDEKTLLGSYSASIDVQREGADLVFNGFPNGFDLTRLISHRFQIEQAVEAIEVASHPTASSMKIMILPGQISSNKLRSKG
jgi:L-iditol 2-dehydrogenase